MRILLCPLVLIVNVDGAICSEMCLTCKEHWWNKEMCCISLNKTLGNVLAHWKISRHETVHSQMVRIKELFMQYPWNSHVQNI
jgi:hypothetical protein